MIRIVCCAMPCTMQGKRRKTNTAFKPSEVQSEMGQPWADVEKGHPPLLTCRKYLVRNSNDSYRAAGVFELISVLKIWVRSKKDHIC